jgi:hypothetical protein
LFRDSGGAIQTAWIDQNPWLTPHPPLSLLLSQSQSQSQPQPQSQSQSQWLPLPQRRASVGPIPKWYPLPAGGGSARNQHKPYRLVAWSAVLGEGVINDHRARQGGDRSLSGPRQTRWLARLRML